MFTLLSKKQCSANFCLGPHLYKYWESGIQVGTCSMWALTAVKGARIQRLQQQVHKPLDQEKPLFPFLSSFNHSWNCASNLEALRKMWISLGKSTWGHQDGQHWSMQAVRRGWVISLTWKGEGFGVPTEAIRYQSRAYREHSHALHWGKWMRLSGLDILDTLPWVELRIVTAAQRSWRISVLQCGDKALSKLG